jgi:hypothetical protein
MRGVGVGKLSILPGVSGMIAGVDFLDDRLEDKSMESR